MATRSPTQTHSYWGKFPDATSLPSGDTRLQSGDTAYAEQEASLYVYDATAAAWEVLGNIAGTIAATEVAFGTGTDTIDGSADLTWDDGNKTLTVTGDANPALVIASAIDGAFLQVTPTTRELAITDPLNPTDATAVSPTDVAVSNGTQSGNVAAGQVSVTDTGSTNTLRASIPGGVATITSENGSTVAQPLDLEIGELQINTDPGAVGEVLTSNGPGAAPTWQAGGGGGGITELTADVEAGPGSGSVTSKVVALQNNAVSSVAPTSGQVLTWSSGSSQWIPANATGGGSGGGTLFYLNENTAAAAPTTNIPVSTNGLVTVKQLGTTSNVPQTTITSSNLSQVNYDLICNFVTDVNVPNLTLLPAGLWDFQVWASSTTNNPNQTILQFRVGKYDGVNAPTIFSTSDDVSIYDPTVVAQYIATCVIPAGTTLLAGDRLYVEVRAKATNNNRKVVLSFGGNTPSHVATTIAGTAGGDLSGTYPDPTVVGLQGRSISSTAPTSNQILQWISGTSKWTPTANGVGLGSKYLLVVEGGSYATVQAAINAASDTDLIIVGPKASGGSWGPAVFPAQKRLSLVGIAPKVSEYPKIDSVTYSPTSGLNINENTVYISRIFISGDYSASPAVTFGGTNLGRLRLQECFIYNIGTSGTVVSLNNSASSGGTQSTTYIDNCTIQTAAVLGTMVDHVAGYTVIKNNSILEGGLNAFKSSAGTVEIFDTQLQSNVATEAVIRVNGGLISITSSRVVNENVAGYGAFINAAAPANYFGANNSVFLVGGASPGASARCVTGVNATALYVYGQVVYGTPIPAAQTVTVVTSSSVLQEAATGDLSGNYPAPKVAALQGRAVSATLPTAGQALVYVGSTWTPTTLATPVTSVTATSPLTSSGGTTPVIAITNPLPVANGGTALTTVPANGRLLIGNGTNYTLANLTAGTGISVTNGAGSITIAATATAAPISTALNGSAANGSPTYVGSVYVPASITLAATSRARIGVSGANQSVKLELLDTSAVVKATFQNVSATGFVDALVTGTPTLAAGWYDILLTANTGGSTAFARGLYLV